MRKIRIACVFSCALIVVTVCDGEKPSGNGNEAPIVDYDEADVKPIVLKKDTPEYPRDAQENGWSGTVFINALVGTDGLVEEARVRESSGYESLDNAALESALLWQFVPGEHRGRPAWVWVKITFTFEL
ncbi:energy transducer TonB [candidate division WOR-3 bacterium]|nr:energy transducer TonB [candidate division WOR-3 bacterium]